MRSFELILSPISFFFFFFALSNSSEDHFFNWFGSKGVTMGKLKNCEGNYGNFNLGFG